MIQLEGKPQVWAIVGGQAGSEAKGKVASLLAHLEKPDVAVCAFSPNAGHTAYDPEGRKWVFHQLPVGVLNPTTTAVIGPGALINLDVLRKEITDLGLGPDRVRIDYRAWLIDWGDQEQERRQMQGISSTCQGVGAALSRRILRTSPGDLEIAMEGRWKEYLCDTTEFLEKAYANGARIQLEGSQGVDIDLLHGIAYPYCTSRSVTASALANDCGLPAQLVERTVMVCRTYPIRVGDAFDRQGRKIGTSGPYAQDSVELSWEEIRSRCKAPIELTERTTVTQKIRRVFEWSNERFKRALWLHGATDIFLNFVNYLTWDCYEATDWSQLSPKTRRVLGEWMVNHLGPSMSSVIALGTGPGHDHYLPWNDLWS